MSFAPSSFRAPRTRAVRAGIDRDVGHGAVVPPIHLSSNFSFAAFGTPRKYDYTRSGNPTRSLLADALADLEGGAGAVVTSSGMSAITLVLQLVPTGGRILCAHDCYGGTWRLLNSLALRGHFTLELVDLTAPDAAAVVRKARPDLVWIETPSNPLLRITDIRVVCEAATSVGALSVVDNTFLSPARQRPLALGADLVVHSTTKYLNGHSDVVGGAVVTRDAALLETLAFWSNCLGVTGAPFDSYLTLRGLRTLHPRLELHEENADAIVARLAQHDVVRAVYYPGLATHPGHNIARRQQDGFGAMIGVELHGGLEAARVFASTLECFSLAESLGGVESLVAHPATMTHASMAPEARAKAGITDGLLRLSVGIEDSSDLVRDIERALDAAATAVDAPASSALPIPDIAPASSPRVHASCA
ncbi:MAG: cystathionine gamma-synthase [Gemmatimonadaceae bacterium]|nr:cystathionine gamma-synthase [Gemmatimonadaceae bacterium]